MTVDVLIHAIVTQTTILIAQLATSRGIRAPLAQIANQVFLDLAGELERQRVSRKVSADMFGLGLRTYRRKIQRLSESATERGRSLWEVIREFLAERNSATRIQILERFSGDDEAQVKAVLHDLCESGLIVSSGAVPNATYRPVGADELIAMQQARGAEGLDELLLALIFREAPQTAEEIARRAKLGTEEVESVLTRLVQEGRVERKENGGTLRYQAASLVIPLGATAGWEAGVFDHFKAMVTTVVGRLHRDSAVPTPADRSGGSTYTVSVWPGHPLAEEVYGTLGRLRGELGELRQRVAKVNQDRGLPDAHTRVVIYVGQSLIEEENGKVDAHA